MEQYLQNAPMAPGICSAQGLAWSPQWELTVPDLLLCRPCQSWAVGRDSDFCLVLTPVEEPLSCVKVSEQMSGPE